MVELMREGLLEMLDAHGSAVLEGVKVVESLLRAGRALQCLGESRLALRAYVAVRRLASSFPAHMPPRPLCTYPGCAEVAKDVCNTLHRLVLQRGAAYGSVAVQGYLSHMARLLPDQTEPGPLPPPPPLPPGPQVRGASGRKVRVVYGVLTTYASYRSRAATVKATWRARVEDGHFFFYGDERDDGLPITPYAVLEVAMGSPDDERFAQERHLLDLIMQADYGSSLPKFFVALLDMFLRLPDAPWCPRPTPEPQTPTPQSSTQIPER